MPPVLLVLALLLLPAAGAASRNNGPEQWRIRSEILIARRFFHNTRMRTRYLELARHIIVFEILKLLLFAFYLFPPLI